MSRAQHAGGLSRRGLIRAGAVTALGTAGAWLAACGESQGPAAGQDPLAGTEQTGKLITSGAKLPAPFTRPLRLPPMSSPTTGADGAAVHQIRAVRTDVEILPGYRTPVFAYEGAFPGPTIESRRGRPTHVEFTNALGLPSVIHLHGSHTPPESDGFPTDLVLPPGQRRMPGHAAPNQHTIVDPQAVVSEGHRRYTYPLDQPAAMLWYHDHRMDFTGPMVYRGLAGVHVVRDEVEDALPIPRGERELPLVVQDRSFGRDGAFKYPAMDASLAGEPGVTKAAMHGVLGDVVLVNGVPWPVAEVDAARYRLRWLNGSNARRYRLRLDPAPPSGPAFVQIGSDVGLLAAPITHETITLAAAERCDTVVDFGQYPVGTHVTVRNELGRDTSAVVMRFVVARRPAAADDARVPAVLADPDDAAAPTVTAATVRRHFRLRRQRVYGRMGWAINDLPFDPTRPIATPPAGGVEVWTFNGDVHHPIHLHLGHFRVLKRNGGPPGDMDAGWKDTVDLRRAQTVELAVRFPNITGRYVLHCHNLEHEDMMMMARFDTV